MDEEEREKWVKESAEYIREKKIRDSSFAGLQLEDGQGVTKREEIIGRLKEAQKLADKLEKVLEPLYLEIDLNGLPQRFCLAERHLRRAYDDAFHAKVYLDMTLREGIPPARTKAMTYHQSAVRLAAACFAEPNPKEIKALAVRVIEEAGLSEDYSERALEEWWQSVKKEFWKD